MNDKNDKNKTKPRTYMQERGDVVAFLHWAEREKYLPRDSFDYSEIETIDLSPGERDTCTPDVLAKVIACSGYLRDEVCISLGAHAGIRHEEIVRFVLRFVDMKNRVINMPPFYNLTKITKVEIGRKIRIQPVLYARLERLFDEGFPKNARVMRVQNWAKRLRQIKKAANVDLPPNAFRHGYGSHRLQLTQDIGRTALEMGTSEQYVRDHYALPKDEPESLAWFAV